jgi:hypothetical protein
VPVYTGRVFLPCGVSRRMQSFQDVIDLISSVQYAQHSAAHVSKRVCFGEEGSFQRRGKR